MNGSTHRKLRRIGREMGQRVGDEACIAAHASRHYVRQWPWRAVAIAAVVAAALGYAAGRR
jgi:ElaB/YqjD/DUF883 family membrane-anchored ribosome-binding protein